jgi:hypothetical protein
LCAQWSAADAAQETASLSYAGNWISAFGALLSFLSVILVLLALRQGREANRIAAEGAKDADEALAHSRKVALAELRPWVVYNGLECSEAERGVVAGEVIDEKFLIAFLKFVNSGKTPANNCRMWSALLVTGMDDPAPTFEPVIDEIKRTVLAPNFPLNTATCIIRPAEFADVIAHRSCFWLYGYARYEDPTEQGNTYETETTVRVTFSGLQRLPDGREYPNFFGVPEGPQNRMT